MQTRSMTATSATSTTSTTSTTSVPSQNRNIHERNRNINVMFLGDGSVGKTSLVMRAKGESYNPNPIPTLGVDVHSVNHQGVRINMWDMSGRERRGGQLHDGYYIDSDIGVVVCNEMVSSQLSIRKWVSDYVRVCPSNPVIVVYNKVVFSDHPLIINYDCIVSTKNGNGVTELLNRIVDVCNGY